LIGEIQKFKQTKIVSEDMINSSLTMKKMREEASHLVRIIDEQQNEISQLRYFKDTYEKQKKLTQESDRKRDEIMKSYQTEISHQKDNISA